MRTLLLLLTAGLLNGGIVLFEIQILRFPAPWAILLMLGGWTLSLWLRKTTRPDIPNTLNSRH